MPSAERGFKWPSSLGARTAADLFGFICCPARRAGSASRFACRTRRGRPPRLGRGGGHGVRRARGAVGENWAVRVARVASRRQSFASVVVRRARVLVGVRWVRRGVARVVAAGRCAVGLGAGVGARAVGSGGGGARVHGVAARGARFGGGDAGDARCGTAAGRAGLVGFWAGWAAGRLGAGVGCMGSLRLGSDCGVAAGWTACLPVGVGAGVEARAAGGCGGDARVHGVAALGARLGGGDVGDAGCGAAAARAAVVGFWVGFAAGRLGAGVGCMGWLRVGLDWGMAAGWVAACLAVRAARAARAARLAARVARLAARA